MDEHPKLIVRTFTCSPNKVAWGLFAVTLGWCFKASGVHMRAMRGQRSFMASILAQNHRSTGCDVRELPGLVGLVGSEFRLPALSGHHLSAGGVCFAGEPIRHLMQRILARQASANKQYLAFVSDQLRCPSREGLHST